MDLATIEPALCTLAAALTGLPVACCVMENAPRPMAAALVILSWVSRTGRGEDWETWAYEENADPLLEMTPTVEGLREGSLQFAVEVLSDQRSGHNASALIERARTRLARSSTQEALNAVSLALASVGPATQADYRHDNRMVSRSLFEVRLNGCAGEADATGRTSYIATVGLDGTVQRPDGTDVPETLQPTTG